MRFELWAGVREKEVDALEQFFSAVAATALLLEADPLTMNVRHFPMIAGLRAVY